MKAYKGFNKDMTCRGGFQFEEGKEYEEKEAKLRGAGFHACLNPLDCFTYYAPGTSVFHEVELDEVSDERQNNSKVCGKKIKIGGEISTPVICKLHFDWTKSRCKHHNQGENCADLSAGHHSILSAGNYSSLSAQDYSSLSAGDCSSLSAQDYSSLSTGHYSSLLAGIYSSLSALNYSSLLAQERSSLSARNYSSLSAGNSSSLSAQNYSSLSAGDCSSLSAQDYSSLSAGDCSSLSAQNYSSLSAGDDSVLSCFNGKCKAGLNSIITIANREWKNNQYVITDFKSVIVDGEKIKADTWYTLKNGEFIEVLED